MPWIQKEQTLYWAGLVFSFLAVAVWESLQPRGPLRLRAERRWLNHVLLMFGSAFLNTLVFRGGPVLLALFTKERGWGLFHLVTVPAAAQWAITILAVDLCHYFTHWSFHNVGFLWRIHEVHHSDPDYDVSTGSRFHPLESLIAQASVFAVVLLLGTPAAAVFVSELLSLIVNFCVHANARLPGPIEKLARLALITPEIHRIHHSVEIRDQNGNLGQTLVVWDRIFGTYVGQSQHGQGEYPTGLKEFDGEETYGLGFLLAQPFRRRLSTPAETTNTEPASRG